MKGYVEKTIRGKRAVCKTVTTHTRDGRSYMREMCYELKPDGTKGKLVSSRLAGKPRYTPSQLHKIEASRNPKSRRKDESKNANTIISPTDVRVNSWAENPSVRRRIDIDGIDTIGVTRTVRKTARKERTPSGKKPKKASPKTTKKSGDIVCTTYITKAGNKFERCRNIKTGKLVSAKVL